ncbi:hypothetical protein Tco_0286724 [Tanacetum coccineum]
MLNSLRPFKQPGSHAPTDSRAGFSKSNALVLRAVAPVDAGIGISYERRSSTDGIVMMLLDQLAVYNSRGRVGLVEKAHKVRPREEMRRASENSTEYMQAFPRLAGLLGQPAALQKNSEELLVWGLHKDDYDRSERSDKRHKSGDRYHPYSQQGSHRSHGQSDDRQRSDMQGNHEDKQKEQRSESHRSTNSVPHIQGNPLRISRCFPNFRRISEELPEYLPIRDVVFNIELIPELSNLQSSLSMAPIE